MTDRPTIQRIIKAAEDVCMVGAVEILSQSRIKSVNVARQCVMVVAVKTFGFHATEVADAVKKDRSTVLHALKRERLVPTNQTLLEDIAHEAVNGVETATPKPRESAYSVSDKNDMAMVRSGADRSERALIALLRLDYGKYEIELPRKPYAEVSTCFAD